MPVKIVNIVKIAKRVSFGNLTYFKDFIFNPKYGEAFATLYFVGCFLSHGAPRCIPNPSQTHTGQLHLAYTTEIIINIVIVVSSKKGDRL